ncbi:MAG: hypothetical protein JXA68_04800 [Ignavibacteriales bacterium]|nr:hypothetical protein [Ignavibacteriales bacterium]
MKTKINKNSKKISGFTLIETIVGINLSFLLLTSLISFYLFISKYVASTTRNFEDKQIINEFFVRLNDALKKSDEFFYVNEHGSNFLLFNQHDTITFNKESLDIKKIYKINKIDSYEIIFKLFSGEQNKIKGNAENDFIYSSLRDSKLKNSEIVSISFSIVKNKKEYQYFFYNKKIANKNFQNISS